MLEQGNRPVVVVVRCRSLCRLALLEGPAAPARRSVLGAGPGPVAGENSAKKLMSGTELSCKTGGTCDSIGGGGGGGMSQVRVQLLGKETRTRY